MESPVAATSPAAREVGSASAANTAATTITGQGVTITQFGQLQQELAERLCAEVTSAEGWLDAVARFPRHQFLPDRAWRLNKKELVPLDRAADPKGWIEAAYSLNAIIIQHIDGMPTSSCSMPAVVLEMLEALDPQPGNRVLEIGTGTGWNAALLVHRLGEDQVVTVEVDPQLAEQARRNLAAAGVAPTVITADGAEGHPGRAPYDRIIATCGVNRIPASWVEQTAEGGVIVVPWESPLGLGGRLKLTVHDGVASGRFVDTSSFMWLRGQRSDPPDEPDEFATKASTSSLTVDLAAIRENLARFVIGLAVPECRAAEYYAEDEVWLLAVDSWASVDVRTGEVRQHGARRLWDEVEAAYRWWDGAGRPDLTRFGVTVTADRQLVWLDEQANEVPGSAGGRRWDPSSYGTRRG